MFRYLIGYPKKDEKDKKIEDNKKDNKELTKNYNLLKNINTDNVDYFSFKGKTFYAKPCNVYDGDTFSVVFDHKGELIKYRCRCFGYDTPEMRPSRKLENRDEIKKKAVEAKNYLKSLIMNENQLVYLKCGKFGKFGRCLVKVFINKDDLEDKTKSVNKILLNENLAYKYYGGTKNNDFTSYYKKN